MGEQKFQLLHISDIHIDTNKNFDRSTVLDPLIKRVIKDKGEGFEPEIIVVTGDIACAGKKEEYEHAKRFFDDLLKATDLPKERLFLVPGNHDVDRERYRKSDVPKYDNMRDLNTELENREFRDDLFKGLSSYFEFVKSNYPHLKSIHGDLVPFVHNYKAKTGHNIGLLGLNSAWMCRKSPDDGKIAIGEHQVKNAMAELKEKGEPDITICLFHHPLQWLWTADRSRLDTYLDKTIVLSGHLHEPGGGFHHGLYSSLFSFQAGGAYTGTESEDDRCQYITFDFGKDEIRLDFRKKVKERPIWCIDSETGDDGNKVYSEAGIKERGESAINPLTSVISDGRVNIEKFDHYLIKAANEHRHLPAQGFETALRIPIEIEKIYVNMRAHINAYEFENTVHGKKCHKEKLESQQASFLDIKGAFKAAKYHKVKDIIILGDPGSGKTTLLKYILVMIADLRAEEKLGISSETVPFFAPLHKLKDPDNETLFSFIKRVCFHGTQEISEEDFRNLLKNGQGLILLDGLDEVADKEARLKVCKWIDKVRKEFVRTRFIITSRFAGYLGDSRLEGSVLELSVQDFTLDEVESFLVRWFETVESAIHSDDPESYAEKGRDKAVELFNTIKTDKFEHLRKIAVNPLLLQIIALVHRDRGSLPQRRVELYDECVNVLLEKRDKAKGLENILSARESRKVLQPLAFFLHEKDERRYAPLDAFIDGVRESLESMGKRDIDAVELIENVRDRSGIFMGYNETEYGFAHQSFQEYLTAEHIRNMDMLDLLVEKYDNRWWREVILQCLALDNPSVIERFMHKIIRTEFFKTDITILTDAIKDSIVKPVKPFEDALKEGDLSKEAKGNALMILGILKGTKDHIELSINDAVSANTEVSVVLSVGSSVSEKQRIIRNARDDSEMVLIPAGTFLFGSREDDKMASSDEKPQRTIHLDDYYMDLYPVTNRQYCEFLNQEKPDSGLLNKWMRIDGSFQKEKCRINQLKQSYTVDKGYENHPVIYVSWYGAEAYAKWAGKRLPTEQEWEKAARGTRGQIYPWGDEFDTKRCNSGLSGMDMTSPVDRYPEGISPYGCFDMAGNVWEWTSSFYNQNNGPYVLRGGSWYFGNVDIFRCAVRYYCDPFGRNFFIGFRCART